VTYPLQIRSLTNAMREDIYIDNAFIFFIVGLCLTFRVVIYLSISLHIISFLQR
jgi:hypothetical protein